MAEKIPNFLILGAQKGGTTWLYDNLKKHNEIFLPEQVELLHFNKLNCHTVDAKNQYLKHFENVKSKHIAIGEKSPSYFWTINKKRISCQPSSEHNPNIPHEVKKQLGSDIKLIITFRHPVWRAISAFFHHAKRNRLKPNTSLSQYINKFGILDLGFYSEHLQVWKQEFKENNFCLLVMERDIIEKPETGFSKVCNFLGVSENHGINDFHRTSNKGSWSFHNDGIIKLHQPDSSFVSVEDISFLLEAYRDEMDALRDLISDSIQEWKHIDRAIERHIINHKKFQVSVSENLYHSAINHGIDLSENSLRASNPNASAAPPVKLGNAILMHNSTIDSFSYLGDGYVYSTDIGRYCSISIGIHIGQGNHPTNWLSSNPFQYQQKFRIRHGDAFPFKKEYSSYKIKDENMSLVKKDVFKPRTRIGNDVWIGYGAIITAGISIGDGAVIGAGAVVTRDVPPYAIVVGVPAKILKYRFDEKTIQELLELQWWQYAPWDLADVSFNNIKEAIRQIQIKKACGYVIPYKSVFMKFSSFKAPNK